MTNKEFVKSIYPDARCKMLYMRGEKTGLWRIHGIPMSVIEMRLMYPMTYYSVSMAWKEIAIDIKRMVLRKLES